MFSIYDHDSVYISQPAFQLTSLEYYVFLSFINTFLNVLEVYNIHRSIFFSMIREVSSLWKIQQEKCLQYILYKW